MLVLESTLDDFSFFAAFFSPVPKHPSDSVNSSSLS
uniref:Uncharacterized protein n=1 Tax=Arundo donax TaxID=35708 RepID=A0A0A8ZT98_ARUDO